MVFTETNRKREQYQPRQHESVVRISEITRCVYVTAHDSYSVRTSFVSEILIDDRMRRRGTSSPITFHYRP